MIDAPPSLLSALRGDPGRRPAADPALGAGVRALLEDELFAVLGDSPRRLVVTPASVRGLAGVADITASRRARLRGALVGTGLRVILGGGRPAGRASALWASWISEAPAPLAALAVDLPSPERQRLLEVVDEDLAALARAIGVLPSSWARRTGARAEVRVRAGTVVLRDAVDLVLGSTRVATRDVVLLDVVTSPLGEGTARLRDYHALVETLRTGVAPLRTAILSAPTAEWSIADVDFALLARAARHVADIAAEGGAR